MRSDLWGDTNRIDRATLPSLSEMVSEQIGLAKPVITIEEEVEKSRQTL